MALLQKLKDSILGMQGNRPRTFGVNPVPPDSLHETYSVDGDPTVRWRLIKKNLPYTPLPSTLDELDKKAPSLTPGGVVSQVYKSARGRRYVDLGPTEGRY